MTSRSQTALDLGFEALANRYRRRILLSLARQTDEQDPCVRIPDDVVDTGEDSQRVRLALRHAHVPKLAQLEFVTWEQTAGEIRPGPQFDRLVPLLRLLDGNDDELPGHWA